MDTTELRFALHELRGRDMERALRTYALGLLDRAEADDASNDDEGQGPYYMAGRYRAYSIEVRELAKALGLPATLAQEPATAGKDGE